MKRFIEGEDRSQSTLFPDRLEDWINEDNPVRVVNVFVDELDLGGLGFVRVAPRETGRPGYHPSVLLKLYIYGYLNRVQSSRRLYATCRGPSLPERNESFHSCCDDTACATEPWARGGNCRDRFPRGSKSTPE